MSRVPLLFIMLIGVLLQTGCQTPPPKEAPYQPLVARFYLETKTGEAGVAVTLPVSGVSIMVAPKPVLVEYDIVNAELVEVELGRCLMFQISGPAARDLYRLSVSSVGRRLVLALNDQFVGARPIAGAMSDGIVFIFVELDEAALPEAVERLKSTSRDVAAAAKKARQ